MIKKGGPGQTARSYITLAGASSSILFWYSRYKELSILKRYGSGTILSIPIPMPIPELWLTVTHSIHNSKSAKFPSSIEREALCN